MDRVRNAYRISRLLIVLAESFHDVHRLVILLLRHGSPYTSDARACIPCNAYRDVLSGKSRKNTKKVFYVSLGFDKKKRSTNALDDFAVNRLVADRKFDCLSIRRKTSDTFFT